MQEPSGITSILTIMSDATHDSSHIQLLGKAHGFLVHPRRVTTIADRVAAILPPVSTILDIGCGDGTIARQVAERTEGLTITGAEYSPRPTCAIPCVAFDGVRLPFDDQSFDGCMFVDVLHHSHDPLTSLRDAARVARDFVVIKDHVAESTIDHWTLRGMDWVGNRPHGVEMTYRYLSNKQWQQLFKDAGLEQVRVDTKIPLYPFPFSAIFVRKLHMVTLLKKTYR